MQAEASGGLRRGLDLRGALAANLLNMVGIGPFITIPLALAAMGGPQALLGWVLGALICACDGLVWAELGSSLPHSGGPYHYLRQGFGPLRFGRLMGFLFLWQSLLIGPLSIASGAVGFAQYFGHLAPQLSSGALVAVAIVLCLANTLLLFRDIASIQRLSVLITVAVIGTCVWIIISGLFSFDPKLAFDFPAGAFEPSQAFWIGLGSASLIAVYDYGGYSNVCLVGGEVNEPSRTIPRAVLFSIGLVAILYIAINLSIIGTLPWQVAQKSQAVVADFMAAVYGPWGGQAVSVLILIASWGSAFAILLGFSRVPFAAAEAGQFFSIFARIHTRGRFPTVSLLYMGFGSAIACLVSLTDLIGALIVVQTMMQFIGQCVAVILLRRQRKADSDTFHMPFFPIPAVLATLGWFYIVATSSVRHMIAGVVMMALGTIVFLVNARRSKEWPFALA